MSKKVGRNFWWLWVVANILGNALLPILVWQDAYDLRSQILINEILHAIGISIAQSVMLRDRFAREAWWLPLTLLGWIVGLTIVFFVPALALRSQGQNLPDISRLFVSFAIIGTIVGICQWQLLKGFRAAGLWLFVSAIALSLSVAGLYLGYMAKSTLLANILQGVIYGAITGLFMIRILRSAKIKNKN